MLRSYRHLVFALVGWLALTAVKPPDRDGAKHGSDPKEAADRPFAAYPNLNEDACYKAQDHDAADLCAQWRAAIAAERAAKATEEATSWSRSATVLSAMALGALIWTLIQTERALKESRRGNVMSMRENARSTRRALAGAKETADALDAAHKGAVAAEKQTAIAAETAYRQLRSYVSLEDVAIESANPKAIGGKLYIRNAGQTPAAIKLYVNQWVCSWPRLELPTDAPAPVRHDFHAPYINARSREGTDWFYPMGYEAPEKIKLLMDSPTQIVLLLYGRVEFVDYTGRERILFFAYRNHGGVAVGKGCEMIACPFGNKYEDRGKA